MYRGKLQTRAVHRERRERETIEKKGGPKKRERLLLKDKEMSIYDKKGVRLLFIMLSSLMLAVVMVACAKQEPTGEETADIPQEVQNAAENYLEAFKKGGAAESTKYAYYPTEELREQHAAQSGQTLENYKIEKIEKLTDTLYAVTWTAETNIYDSAQTIFGFVGNVDGKWLYIGNTDYVPQDMKEGLDLSHYEYTDPNIL